MTKNTRYNKFFCAAIFLFFAFFLATGVAGEEKDGYLRLGIGDPELKDKILSVSPNKLYSLSEGQVLEFSRMIENMMSSRFIYIGESHNSLPMHDIQLKIIEALYERDEGLAIGLEMIPITLQHVLNQWSLGILTKEEFIRDVSWYETWNFNYGFYEKIFEFARRNRIPMYGLNVPKKLISKIRMKGWDSLDENEKNLVPEPDVSHQDHRTLIRAIFESSDLPPQMKGPGLDKMFEGLYRSQSAWDESMAFYASRASKESGRRIVILAGSGHVLYNLGINRRAHELNGSPFKTAICLEIPKNQESTRISRSLADYVWGLNEEVHPVFPSIGLAFKKFDGLSNLVIDREPINGVAKGENFVKGDVVLSVDGQTFYEANELRTYLARFRWNEEVKFRLLREARELDVILKFLPEDEGEHEK